eukprot:TRINITY_DN9833_c0_g3_i1.p1 TRINITY_DN9833_c0_g3~~TRINITY_DN9833_c0_g3_i1.p1  ORF type:complete len:826 (-),score=174.33 TRINITY_DN9833_c0_g3_i1:142-2619(-)
MSQSVDESLAHTLEAMPSRDTRPSAPSTDETTTTTITTDKQTTAGDKPSSSPSSPSSPSLQTSISISPPTKPHETITTSLENENLVHVPLSQDPSEQVCILDVSVPDTCTAVDSGSSKSNDITAKELSIVGDESKAMDASNENGHMEMRDVSNDLFGGSGEHAVETLPDPPLDLGPIEFSALDSGNFPSPPFDPLQPCRRCLEIDAQRQLATEEKEKLAANMIKLKKKLLDSSRLMEILSEQELGKAQMQAEQRKLQDSYKLLEDLLMTQEQAISALKKEKESLNTRLQKEIQSHTAEVESANRQVSALKDLLDKSKDDYKSLSSEILKKDSLNKKLSEQVASLKSDVDGAKSRFLQSPEYVKIKRELDERNQSLQAQKAEIQQLKQQIASQPDSLKETIERLKDEQQKTLQMTMETHRKALDNLSQEVRERDKQIQQLQDVPKTTVQPEIRPTKPTNSAETQTTIPAKETHTTSKSCQTTDPYPVTKTPQKSHAEIQVDIPVSSQLMTPPETIKTAIQRLPSGTTPTASQPEADPRPSPPAKRIKTQKASPANVAPVSPAVSITTNKSSLRSTPSQPILRRLKAPTISLGTQIDALYRILVKNAYLVTKSNRQSWTLRAQNELKEHARSHIPAQNTSLAFNHTLCTLMSSIVSTSWGSLEDEVGRWVEFLLGCFRDLYLGSKKVSVLEDYVSTLLESLIENPRQEQEAVVVGTFVAHTLRSLNQLERARIFLYDLLCQVHDASYIMIMIERVFLIWPETFMWKGEYVEIAACFVVVDYSIIIKRKPYLLIFPMEAWSWFIPNITAGLTIDWSFWRAFVGMIGHI